MQTFSPSEFPPARLFSHSRMVKFLLFLLLVTATWLVTFQFFMQRHSVENTTRGANVLTLRQREIQMQIGARNTSHEAMECNCQAASSTVPPQPFFSALNLLSPSLCRPGTQRCISSSLSTPYTRFPLVHSDQSGHEMHGRLSSEESERSRAPYDIDGTPALRKRLHAYIEQHRRGTDLRAMLSNARMATGVTQGKSVALLTAFEERLAREKYALYVDDAAGLANKLLPLVSTFTYALLTNRTFLWNFVPTVLGDLVNLGPPAEPAARPDDIQRPRLNALFHNFIADMIRCYREIDPSFSDGEDVDPYQLPGASNHWTNNVSFALFHSDPSPANARTSAYPTDRTFGNFLKLFPKALGMTPLDIQSPSSGKEKANLVCEDVITRDRDAWLVYSWSNQYWLPTLASNAFLRGTLLSWVNEGNMYGPLARWVLDWHPTEIRAVAETFARSQFSQYNIGLQLRMKERLQISTSELKAAVAAATQLAASYQAAYDVNDPDSFHYGYELSPNSVRQAELRLDPTGKNRSLENPSMRYRGYDARKLASFREGVKPRPFVTFFIATDHFPAREKLVQLLSPYGHVAIPPNEEYPRDEKFIHSDAGAYYAKGKGDLTGLKWAIIENLLLSSCDDIIVSPSSSYGYAAYGYGSLIPHRILLDPIGMVLRHLNAEPLVHFWKPLFREVPQMDLCRTEADLPVFLLSDECCPRYTQGGHTNLVGL